VLLTIINRIFFSGSRGIKLGKAVGVYSLVNRRPMCWVCDRTAVTCREVEDPFWMETTRSEEFVSSEEFEAIAHELVWSHKCPHDSTAPPEASQAAPPAPPARLVFVKPGRTPLNSNFCRG
jgi:hypothetical protein